MNATVAYHLSTTQGFVFTLSFMLSAKQEAVNTNFLKFFGMTRPGVELWVYRFASGRSIPFG